MEDDETIWNSLECCRFYDERLRSTANMLGHPIIIISFHVKSIKLSWNMYDIVYTSNKKEHHWASLYTYLDWYCSGSSGGSEFTLGNWMCTESSNSFQFQCSSGRFGPRRLLIGFMSTSCQRSSRQKAGIWTTSLAECSKSNLFVFALGFSTAFGTVASLLLLPWRLQKKSRIPFPCLCQFTSKCLIVEETVVQGFSNETLVLASDGSKLWTELRRQERLCQFV